MEDEETHPAQVRLDTLDAPAPVLSYTPMPRATLDELHLALHTTAIPSDEELEALHTRDLFSIFNVPPPPPDTNPDNQDTPKTPTPIHWLFSPKSTPLNHYQQKHLLRPRSPAAQTAQLTARDLNTPEYDRFLKDTFKTAFLLSTQSLADTHRDRIAVAWRITREIARTKTQIEPDMTLPNPDNPENYNLPYENAAEPHTLDYLQNPAPNTHNGLATLLQAALRLKSRHWPHMAPHAPATPLDPRDPDAPKIPAEIADLPQDQFLHHPDPAHRQHPDAPPETNLQTTLRRPGCPLQPPPPPLEYYIAQNFDDYDPDNDLGLTLFIRAQNAAAETLNIYGGTQADPHLGQKAMVAITNPALIRLAYPTPHELAEYENLVIKDMLKAMLRHGVFSAYEYGQKKYGFTQAESVAVAAMSRKFAYSLTVADKEEERAMMVLKLDMLQKQARNALDNDMQLKTMKQAGMVLGLTARDPDEGMKDFAGIIKRHTASKAFDMKPAGYLPAQPEEE